ncbi:MAG: hypothetical protein EHM12_07225 [Dehalococcoidia bacterium]|nr:MAG: hypothetical protein EHM12_07225 [Dehalococcoidia bacterium]
MIVVVSVRGECCPRSHLKLIEVPTDDPDIAVNVAKRSLEYGNEGWEIDEAVAMIDASNGADHNIDPENVPIWNLQNGDEIYWNDPDEGRCSRMLRVKNFEFRGDDVISIEDITGAVVEGFMNEFDAGPETDHA